MKTNYDALDVIFKRLNTLVKPSISGKVYKLRRPLNSKLEDIVINALPISDEIPQECIVNVNCYAPNIETKISGVSTLSPDTKRMKEVAELVAETLEDVDAADYHYFISNQAVLQDESSDEHYTNFRVTFLFTDI